MAVFRPCPAALPRGRDATLWRGLLAGLACFVCIGTATAQTDIRPARGDVAWTQTTVPRADFGAAAPAAEARQLADWIARTRDNHGKPFFVIDKVHATLYVFDRNARLQASTPVLLGAAIGDDSVPGIGNRPMAQIRPFERTTPAGRFVAEVGRNLQGEDIVWVDYDDAVSMHRVRTGNAVERRAERLRTPTVADNRISYGCINVPTAFYNRHVQAVFASVRSAVVYVMPETRSLQEQFGVTARDEAKKPSRRHARAPGP